MIDTNLNYCPRCKRRSLRLGACLQCGFRGAGTAQLKPQDRMGQSKPRRFRFDHETEIDIPFSDGDAGSNLSDGATMADPT